MQRAACSVFAVKMQRRVSEREIESEMERDRCLLDAFIVLIMRTLCSDCGYLSFVMGFGRGESVGYKLEASILKSIDSLLYDSTEFRQRK